MTLSQSPDRLPRDRNKVIAEKSIAQSEVNAERELESYGIRLVRTGLNKQGYDSGLGSIALHDVLDVLRSHQNAKVQDSPSQLTFDQDNS